MRHSVMLEVNEALVLDLVRSRSETTRPEIGAELGLSAASVSRIVRRLIVQGQLTEVPGASTGGRPRSVVRFNASSGAVIGVDLGGACCRGALADLSGRVLVDATNPIADGGAAFPTLVATLRELRADAATLGLPVEAVAVGVAAIVDPETGVASGGPNVHWEGFPIVAELGRVVERPFLVENDVNLAALAHAWRGEGRGHASFAVLAVGTGIGAAIVTDGRLHRGGRGGAGEIGYLVLERSLLRDHRADGPGALEELASGPALAAAARRRLGAEPTLPSGLRAERTVTPEAVFAAAIGGDALASQVIGDLLDHVAMALVALAATIDPEVIVLDGSVGRALAPWCDELAALLARHLPAPPALAVSSLGGDATVLGAVAAALQLARQPDAPGWASNGPVDPPGVGSMRPAVVGTAAPGSGPPGRVDPLRSTVG
jgi:glucokinase